MSNKEMNNDLLLQGKPRYVLDVSKIQSLEDIKFILSNMGLEITKDVSKHTELNKYFILED